MIHVVGYDLREPNDTEENYKLVIDAIKTLFDSWCHIEKSVWLVDSSSESSVIRDTLKDYMHTGDLLFVARLSGAWGSWNFGEDRNSWLKARTF